MPVRSRDLSVICGISRSATMNPSDIQVLIKIGGVLLLVVLLIACVVRVRRSSASSRAALGGMLMLLFGGAVVPPHEVSTIEEAKESKDKKGAESGGKDFPRE
jgi:hypothetical protein